MSGEPIFSHALVDATAQAIRDCCDSWECWEDTTEVSKDFYRKQARRALEVSATWMGPVFEPQT